MMVNPANIAELLKNTNLIDLVSSAKGYEQKPEKPNGSRRARTGRKPNRGKMFAGVAERQRIISFLIIAVSVRHSSGKAGERNRSRGSGVCIAGKPNITPLTIIAKNARLTKSGVYTVTGILNTSTILQTIHFKR
ncbi:hypothetical protein [Escherichia coli]|uniref:hypothetical protein n=1 Tax=Escherichia coli TaxID=562 RepID=UPI0038B30EB6